MISTASLEEAVKWGQNFLDVNQGIEAQEIGWRDLFVHVLGVPEESFRWLTGHLKACLDNGWSEGQVAAHFFGIVMALYTVRVERGEL